MDGRRYRWRRRQEMEVMIERVNGKWRRTYNQYPVAMACKQEADNGYQ